MFIVPTGIPGSLELVTPFAPREIRYAFHDIDGTHSLIRDWVPVMTLTLGWVVENGLPPPEPEEALRQMLSAKEKTFAEAYRFSIESAGLSALTQMEWAIRSALEAGTVSGVPFDAEINREILAQIRNGREMFEEYGEPPELKQLIREKSAELFRIYEKLLLAMSRNRNLKDAEANPEKWRVPGSMEFLHNLRRAGIKNYFVTGAVVERDGDGVPSGTMYEEIMTLQYEIGPGKLLEGLEGSAWHEKLPKKQIMRNLCRKLNVPPEHVLIVGDGRSEIEAGVEMGAVTISRLPSPARRTREIHTALKTNFILEEYGPELFRTLFPSGTPRAEDRKSV